MLNIHKNTHPTLLAKGKASQQKRSIGDDRRRELHVLPVEKGDLHEEASDVLSLGIFKAHSTARYAQPCLSSRVPNLPSDGSKNMAFHLDKGGFVVGVSTNLAQLAYSGHAFFGVLELGSDPQSGTTDELVVLFVNDAAGNVAVDNVASEVEGFRA